MGMSMQMQYIVIALGLAKPQGTMISIITDLYLGNGLVD